MNDPVTTNLADFGERELKQAINLLVAFCEQGLPYDFERDGMTVALNRNSGFVFLTNSEYQTAMINPDTRKLESFYFTPYDGHEGFLFDILFDNDPDSFHDHDVDYLCDLIEARIDNDGAFSKSIPASWLKLLENKHGINA